VYNQIFYSAPEVKQIGYQIQKIHKDDYKQSIILTDNTFVCGCLDDELIARCRRRSSYPSIPARTDFRPGREARDGS